MEININAVVECEDICCGTVMNIIINPVTQAIAYLVIMITSEPHHEVLAPAGMFEVLTPDYLQLKCTERKLTLSPLFHAQNFIKMEAHEGPMIGYLMLPYVLPENLIISLDHKRMPEGELGVRRCARVFATDGHAGNVDEFLVDPANGQITHLVMRQGHVLGLKEVSIPLNAIKRSDEYNVYLSLDMAGLESLPYIPIWRSFMPQWYWSAPEFQKISLIPSAPLTDAIPQLITGLAGSRGQERSKARQQLVAIGRPAIPFLCELLDNKSRQVRWEAAKSLSQIQDTDCIPGLLIAMEDDQFDIRWLAAESMAGYGMPAVKQLLKLLQKKPDSAWLRESAHQVIRSVIKDEPWYEMQSVLIELEKFGTTAASLPRSAKLALESLRTYSHNESGSTCAQRYA